MRSQFTFEIAIQITKDAIGIPDLIKDDTITKLLGFWMEHYSACQAWQLELPGYADAPIEAIFAKNINLFLMRKYSDDSVPESAFPSLDEDFGDAISDGAITYLSIACEMACR